MVSLLPFFTLLSLLCLFPLSLSFSSGHKIAPNFVVFDEETCPAPIKTLTNCLNIAGEITKMTHETGFSSSPTIRLNRIYTQCIRSLDSKDTGGELGPPGPIPNVVMQCLHGSFMFSLLDMYIGRSLLLYGEWSETEVTLFEKLIKPGETVMDIGANIGAFSVPFSKMVGGNGAVWAFEPQRTICQQLNGNVALNGLTNVFVMCSAVGEKDGTAYLPNDLIDLTAAHYNTGAASVFLTPQDNTGRARNGFVTVQMHRLDSLTIEKLNFIKIDAQGSEFSIITHGASLIERLKPIIFLEEETFSDTIPNHLWFRHSYICWRHVVPLYRKSNYRQNSKNVFRMASVDITSKNLLCFHKDHHSKEIDKLLQGHYRNDSDDPKLCWLVAVPSLVTELPRMV